MANNYDEYINKYARQYKLSPDFVKSVIQTESGGDPNAKSGTGAQGLMQVTGTLANQYGYSKEDTLDPEKNIAMGVRYLSENYNHFGGNIQNTLLGYNQGTAGAERQLKSGMISPEGLKYMNNKNFQPYTANSTAENVANPVKALDTGSERSDQFTPALLNRDVAEDAPTQADATAGQITNGLNTVEELNAQREYQRRQMRDQADQQHSELTGRSNNSSEETGDALQQAGIALTAALFGDTRRGTKSVVQSRPQSVGSNYSNATEDQLRQASRFTTPSLNQSTKLF